MMRLLISGSKAISREYTEIELVTLLKDKNERSFEYLYDKYAGTLYRLILQIIPARETASDILQEVFLKIWHQMPSYDSKKGRLFTWMLTITRNSSIDVYRSPAYQNNLHHDCIVESSEERHDILSIQLYTEHIGLHRYINGLKPEYKTLIDLAYLKGYTCRQIAQILQIPLGTVKTRLRFALMKLRYTIN